MPKRKKISSQLICFQLFALLLLPVISVQAQDSTKATKTVLPKSDHSPGKAVLYSTIFPGLGQIYNHKYWKLPIVYAGVGIATYFIIFNQQQYNLYNSALVTRTNGGMDQFYNIYSSTDLSSLVNYYHYDRDLSVVAAAIIYVLNIVDAEVDAQLFHFDVSDDISLHFVPKFDVCTTYNASYAAPALSLVLKIK